MTMGIKQFKECLLLYGADLERWPAEVILAAEEAVARSETCRRLRDEYAAFERTLKARRFEAPSADLKARIIRAALSRPRMPVSLLGFLAECFADFPVPKPAFAVALMLVIGLMIGLLAPRSPSVAPPDPARVQAFLYDDGEVL